MNSSAKPVRPSWIQKLMDHKDSDAQTAQPKPDTTETVSPIRIEQQKVASDMRVSQFWNHLKDTKKPEVSEPAQPVASPTPAPAAQTPVKPDEPSDLSKLIQFGKKDLTANPMSGSILKVLLSAKGGYKEQIERGVKNGHVYTIWHVPPARDFVLCDKYADATGSHTKYHTFTITAEAKDPVAQELMKPLDDFEKSLKEFFALANQ